MSINIQADGAGRGRGRGRGRGPGRGRTHDPTIPSSSHYTTDSESEEDPPMDVDNQPPSPPSPPPQHQEIPEYGTQHAAPQAPPPIPGLAAMHAILAQLVQLHQAQAPVQPAAPVPAPPVQPDFTKTVMLMKNLGTPTFGGSSDPLEADQWIESLDRNFAAMRCSPGFRKDIAVYYLDRDAAIWWSTVERLYPHQGITYDIFRQEFGRKYFPPEARDRLEVQYLALNQGSRTVRDYEAEFTRLRRYAAQAQEESEASSIRGFIRGLRPHIRCHLQVVEHHHLTDLLEKAVNVEESLATERPITERPITAPARAARPGLTPSRQASQRQGGGTTRPRHRFRCSICNRFHSGECTQAPRAPRGCYVCGDTTHLARDCPKAYGATRAASAVPSHIRCFHCDQPGHYATSCPQRRSSDTVGSTRPRLPPPPAKRPATAARVFAIDAPGPASRGKGPLTGE